MECWIKAEAVLIELSLQGVADETCCSFADSFDFSPAVDDVEIENVYDNTKSLGALHITF